MNDIEKALVYLKKSIQYVLNEKNEPHNETEEVIKIMNTAISALEKQIPKKIDYSELNYSNLPVSKCSECKNTTVNRLLECKYCPDCGQKLDWEVENE